MRKHIIIIFIVSIWAQNFVPLHAEETPLEILDSTSKINLTLDTSGASNENLAFKEKKISIDLRQIDIVDALNFIAIRGGINILPSKGISGRINFSNERCFGRRGL